MREMLKMIIVLTALCSFSGGLLAALRNETMEKIENQQLEFVKGPAIRDILKGSANDPIADRFKIKTGETEKSFFVGKFDGKAETVAFESTGKGFGGDIGLMIGVNIANDKIVGIGVTTHSETPGIGSRAKTDPRFAAQFKGLTLTGDFKIKNDGGQVDAISGATVTSKGVAGAVSDAAKTYLSLKPELAEKLKGFK
ncbi:MAG: H+/Na+-translocating ferredoxin:NAD+ oxidoreductase subunit [Thermodesulfobacteriota bacterium]|nr:H+/Na+-translocating ferredoxin:NAD+ oxidoreductase subunit [Thermodesulfobacteriota bacterium]